MIIHFFWKKKHIFSQAKLNVEKKENLLTSVAVVEHMKGKDGDSSHILHLHLHLGRHPCPQHRPPALQHLGKHPDRFVVGGGVGVSVGPSADSKELVLVAGARLRGEDGDALAAGGAGDPLHRVEPLLTQVHRLEWVD